MANPLVERLAGFDEWIAAELEHWSVPGSAIGVVTPDEVLWGEGLRQTER